MAHDSAMRDELRPLKPFASHNRGRMPLGEVRLWMELRKGALGYRFRRQHVIGRYIVDFVCLKERLGVEVDGSQHYRSETDAERDEYLNRHGYRVLRFWAWHVLEFSPAVVAEITRVLNGHPIVESLQPGDEVFERKIRAATEAGEFGRS
ncbi:MAG: DUF559 domain-containing protein [Acidimicrobiia bacterium]